MEEEILDIPADEITIADVPAQPEEVVIAASLTATVEAILFAADRPVGLDRFIEVLTSNEGEGPSKEDINEALFTIKARLSQGDFGFELRETHGGFQFTTKAATASVVRKFLATKPLSAQLLPCKLLICTILRPTNSARFVNPLCSASSSPI